MTSAGASIVSQRLCSLLLSFPEASIAGVQWQTLARKYEDRHGQRLDLSALGHSSALAAASALLWDVLHIVNSEDTDNPIVALDDQAALEPQPGFLGCWPSLYKALCDVVLGNGSIQIETGAGCKGLLMSQLKHLLEKHWHTSFEENGMGYLTAEGSFVKLKKMKHLVQAVIGWREQRVAWRHVAEVSAPTTEVDEALAPILELAASSRHNDLILRCNPAGPISHEMTCTPQIPAAPRPVRIDGAGKWASRSASAIPQATAPCQEPGAVVDTLTQEPSLSTEGDATNEREALERDLALLRAENAVLRGRNFQLEGRAMLCSAAALQTQPQSGKPSIALEPPVNLQHDVFDDPFEPPPEARQWNEGPWIAASSPAPSSSTSYTSTLDNAWDCASSAFGAGSDSGEGAETPQSSRISSFDFSLKAPSGVMTPRDASLESVGEVHATYLPMPMWWTLLPGGLEIPCGIVQSMRAHFEQCAGSQ